MYTRKEILHGINDHTVEVHSEGPLPFLMQVKQRIAFRGNRFVGIVTKEQQANWLTHGRTTAEPPAARFDPTQYPAEQCR